MIYLANYKSYSWWVPLLGRTPLGLHHTNLCFDYCSPDLLHCQCQVLNLYLKHISSRKNSSKYFQNCGDAKIISSENLKIYLTVVWQVEKYKKQKYIFNHSDQLFQYFNPLLEREYNEFFFFWPKRYLNLKFLQF